MTAESVHNCIEKEIRDLSSCNCLKSGGVCLQRDCGSRPSGSTVKSASRVTSVATFSASAGAENSSCGLDTMYNTRTHAVTHIHRVSVTSFRFISMPASFRRHLVGKTLRNVCHCDIAKYASLAS